MKKYISMIMALIMIVVSSTTVYAGNSISNYKTNLNQGNEGFREEDNVFVSSYKDTIYYLEKDLNCTVAIGLNSKIADCAIIFSDKNIAFHGVINLEKYDLTVNKKSIDDFELIKGMIFEGELDDVLICTELEEIILTNSTKASFSYDSDKELILNELYSDGKQTEYWAISPTATLMQDGMYAEIYPDYFYNLSKITTYSIAFASTLSLLIALTGLSPVTISKVVALGLGVYGEYYALNDCFTTKYSVIGYDERRVWVEGINTYLSQRKTIYEALVGDNNSVGYEEKSTTTPYGHYNNSYLFQQGFSEYYSIVW